MRVSFPLLSPSIPASDCGCKSLRIGHLFLVSRRGRGRFSGGCGAMVLQDDGILAPPLRSRALGYVPSTLVPRVQWASIRFHRFAIPFSPFYLFLSKGSEEPTVGGPGAAGMHSTKGNEREVSREDVTLDRKDLSTPQLRAASTPARRRSRRREPKRKAARIVRIASPHRRHSG